LTEPPPPSGNLPPSSGYLPPPDAYLLPGQPGPNPFDPLVNPPFAGIGGWFSRMSAVFQRSWKSIAAVFAVTHLVPAIALAVLGAIGTATILLPWQREVMRSAETGEDPRFSTLASPLFGFIGVVLVAVLLLGILQAAGYAAGTYAVTREAAGVATPMSDVLRYGFRRCLGLFGWNFLSGLLIFVGALACILPGFYVVAATALVGPIYLFERRTPIGRSFSIFNNNLGRVLGRLAMILLIAIGGSIVASTVENVLNLMINGTGTISTVGPADVSVVGSAVVAGIGAVLGLPFTMIEFVGILLTYAEQRGHEGPATTGTLAAEL
jgi:hypothetical protein